MNRFGFSRMMLVLGLLFIYMPMLILVIYSFNASKLVTVWGGWSVKWYVGLLAWPNCWRATYDPDLFRSCEPHCAHRRNPSP